MGLFIDLAHLLAEVPWPALLLEPDGRIAALNGAVRDLLGGSPDAAVGRGVELLVPERERARLRQLIDEAAAGGQAAPARAHLIRPGARPLPVELDATLIAEDPACRLALVVHTASRHHRREQLILELNRLAPTLTAAQSPDEVFGHATGALARFGLGMAIWEPAPERAALRLHYARPAPALAAHMTRMFGRPPSELHIPQATPGYREALEQRRALFWTDIDAVLRNMMPDPAAAICGAFLHAFGLRSLVIAPLLDGAQVRSVLVVWSSILTAQDVPVIEALGHQLAVVLSQLDLRRRMEAQIQWLDSLATTARAVTTLGSLDDVLRVICLQAQQLLGADHASVCLPGEQADEMVCVMATGRGADVLQGIRLPIADSIIGAVFTSGSGRRSDDVRNDPGVFQPAIQASPSRSALFQPLWHQGSNLGVLVVNHLQPGRFSDADLAFLARYAEHAAVAVANARLHTALQQSEAEQRRQRLELATLLQVSAAVNRSLDLDTILHEGLGLLDELQLVAFGSIYLIEDDDAGSYVLRASRNLPRELASSYAHLDIGRLIFGEEIRRSGRLLLVPDDIARLERVYPDMALLRLSSVAVVPLIAEGRRLGALVINRTDGRVYSEHELGLLEGVAGLLAQAVVKAQVHQALEQTAAAHARLYREAEGIRSYLNTLIRHTPDMLLTIGPAMTIHLLNPERISASTHYLPEQIEGRSFLDFVPERRHAELLACWRRVIGGTPQTLETEIVGGDGVLLTVIFSAVLIPDYGEVFVIVKNVTEQKRVEAQLRQNEKLIALGQLVAGAAHELNNPLAAILGLTQLQFLDDLPPPLRADLELIERATLRASRIVQHLRTFARPQPVEPRELDLARLLDETLSRLAPEVAEAAVDITIDLPPKLPPIVADPHQMEQVLFNILQNALLALAGNPPGAPRALSVACRPTEQGVRLEFADSGPGIAPDDLPRVFDPFFTTRRVGEGTGLGLSIVHGIVRQHGGRIWAESARGRGATFFVELPAAAAAPAAGPRPAAAPKSIGDAGILLVEDEDAVRSVTARALDRLGYHVDAVASGEAALERALSREYALIVSDFQMPGMDGAALYRRLRGARPALRWLILTGDTMGERSRLFVEQNGLPVLAKPFTHDQLAHAVAACLMTADDR